MPIGITGRRLRTRLPLIAMTLTLVATLTNCGLLDDSDEPESSAPGGSSLETSELHVSIMKTTDLAPFHLAMQEGFFEEEGLTVTFVDAKSSDESTQKLVADEVDIAYSSYPPFFLAESKGATKNIGGVKIVADAASAGPNSTVVVALPTSSVKSMKDMAGKRVAVSGPGSVSTLLTMSTLKTNQVDYRSIEWVPTPYPAIAAALKNGHVDAAFVTEPFIQDAYRNAGAERIFDTATGPTEDMPVAGWASSGNYVEENPNTIAAFQRGMQRGTELALSDRSLVEPLLVEFSGVDKDIAEMATLLTFQSKLDVTRLQRVPTMMFEFDIIPSPIDVSSMVVESAPVN